MSGTTRMLSCMRGALRRLRLGTEIVVAVWLLLVIEVSLRSATLPITCRRMRVQADLESRTPPLAPAAVLPRWTRPRVRAALLATARWPGGDTCLRRCLLLGHRLRWLDPVLRIGVRRDELGVFRAHSWLEIQGESLDVGAAGFATLSRPPV